MSNETPPEKKPDGAEPPIEAVQAIITLKWKDGKAAPEYNIVNVTAHHLWGASKLLELLGDQMMVGLMMQQAQEAAQNEAALNALMKQQGGLRRT